MEKSKNVKDVMYISVVVVVVVNEVIKLCIFYTFFLLLDFIIIIFVSWHRRMVSFLSKTLFP